MYQHASLPYWEEILAFGREWQELLDKVEIGGAMPVRFEYRPPADRHDIAMLFITMSVPDVRDGRDVYVQRATVIPRYIKHERDRLEWLQREVLELYRHELAEQFRFDGVQIFDPHKA